MPDRIIKTPRLVLRPLERRDAADAFEWLSDPAVNRYMRYALYTDLREVEAWISSVREEQNIFAYCLRDTGKVIGSGSVTPGADGACELGYNLSRAHWGRGYATEAARAMLHWAHTERGVRDFTVKHAKENTASQNVILKCGFRFDHEGQYSRFDGSETFDALCYVLHME